MVPPTGSSATGQTSSRSTLSVQPCAISRAPKAAASASPAGSPHRRRRRSTASHGPRVLRVPHRAAVPGQRLCHGGQVRGRGQERGVVRVVRGAEEDRLRVRRDGGQLVAADVPDGRVQLHVRGLHLVAVHERGDGDRRGVIGRIGRDQDHGLLVGAGPVPVPPGAVERPAREGGGPGVRIRERVPGRGIHRVERAADGPQGSGTRPPATPCRRRPADREGRRSWMWGSRLRG